MPPALPFEIWAHIASYLSSIELGRLFSINKALYEISMDSRYKTLQLRRPNNVTVSKLRMMRYAVFYFPYNPNYMFCQGYGLNCRPRSRSRDMLLNTPYLVEGQINEVPVVQQSIAAFAWVFQ